MEITGTIYKILPTEEVVLGDGTKRKKGGFVIMREGEYAKPVAFELNPATSDARWNPSGGGMTQDKPFDQVPPDEQLPFDNDLPFF